MLHVTPRARHELHRMLVRTLSQRHDVGDPDLGLRLLARDARESGRSQLSLTLDASHQGDRVVEHDGRPVLIVDSSTSDLLGDLTLDVVVTPEGMRLGIRK